MSLLGSLKRPSAVRSALRLDGPEAPVEAARGGAAAPRPAREELPRLVIVDEGPTETIGGLLHAIASGDREAFVALQNRMGGLVRLNIRRVLQDAARSDAVTEQFFAEVRRDAIEFDPDRDSAQAWLLARAHQRAIESFAPERPDVVEGPTSPRSQEPVPAPGHDGPEDRPASITRLEPHEVSDAPIVLLHL